MCTDGKPLSLNSQHGHGGRYKLRFRKNNRILYLNSNDYLAISVCKYIFCHWSVDQTMGILTSLYVLWFNLCRIVWEKLLIRFSFRKGVDLERQQRRREQNRQAAQRCRKRKRDLADTLNRVCLTHWVKNSFNDNNSLVNLKSRSSTCICFKFDW